MLINFIKVRIDTSIVFTAIKVNALVNVLLLLQSYVIKKACTKTQNNKTKRAKQAKRP